MELNPVFYYLLFLTFVPLKINGQYSQNSSELKTINQDSIYSVYPTCDFNITGDGSSESWTKAEWLQLDQRSFAIKSVSQVTKLKALYSQTGIYFLFFCEDKKLTSTMDADFMDLWYEDVVEVFLWPYEKDPLYFEYEISPLNYELPILIYNYDGDLQRWQPFHYNQDRQTKHLTKSQGGEKKSGAGVESWTTEFYIPYKLLRPLKNVPPKAGSIWRANFYRVDYDTEKDIWSWRLTENSFHDYKKFGTIIFK